MTSTPIRRITGLFRRVQHGVSTRWHRWRTRRMLRRGMVAPVTFPAPTPPPSPSPAPAIHVPDRLPSDVFLWGESEPLVSTLLAAGHRVFSVGSETAATASPGYRVSPSDPDARHISVQFEAGDSTHVRRELGALLEWARVHDSIAVVSDPRWIVAASSQPGAPVIFYGDISGLDEATAAMVSELADVVVARADRDVVGRLGGVPAPTVSLIVVSWNNLALTAACLNSIAAQTGWVDLETIVVDNGSIDGTVDHLRVWERVSPRHHSILNPDNRGFAAACNQGLAAATGQHLVVLNNDIRLAPGAIATLVQHLRRDSTIGLCGPVTNRIANEARVTLPRGAEFPDAAVTWTNRHLGRTFDIPMLAFFCVAMRRSTYRLVGDLDERFTMGFFEDDDYCRRVTAAGLRLVCAEDAYVHHESSAGFGRISPAVRALVFEENRRKFEQKWGPWQRPGRRSRRRLR